MEYQMKDKTKHICRRSFQKALIIVELWYCYVIAHTQTTHYCRSRRDITDFRKWSVFFIQTENDDSLLFSWIYYCFFTILDDVRLGSTKWCRSYLFCMNDTRVRCASRVRQRNLCKIMYGCLGIFLKSISIFISLLIVAFFHASKSPCNLNAWSESNGPRLIRPVYLPQ